jgi:hypothetical protein
LRLFGQRLVGSLISDVESDCVERFAHIQEECSISWFLLVGGFLRRHLVGSDILANAADIARWAPLGGLIASYHLGEKVHIVITFTRHLFADRLQLFKETRAFIHNSVCSG